jgi:K+-sensing histidine kinase KdpD
MADLVRRLTEDFAHELRTPLTHLAIAVEALDRSGCAEAKTMRELRCAAHDAVARSERLIDVVRAEMGLGGELMAPVDLASLVRRAVHAHQAAHGAASVHVRTPRTVAAVGLDALLEQAFGELLAAVRGRTGVEPVQIVLSHRQGLVTLRVAAATCAPRGRLRLLSPRYRHDDPAAARAPTHSAALACACAQLHGGQLWERLDGCGFAMRWAELPPLHGVEA